MGGGGGIYSEEHRSVFCPQNLQTYHVIHNDQLIGEMSRFLTNVFNGIFLNCYLDKLIEIVYNL